MRDANSVNHAMVDRAVAVPCVCAAEAPQCPHVCAPFVCAAEESQLRGAADAAECTGSHDGAGDRGAAPALHG